MNTIFNQEQFEFTEIFLAHHGDAFEDVDAMFVAIKEAWLAFKPNSPVSFHQQATEYIRDY